MYIDAPGAVRAVRRRKRRHRLKEAAVRIHRTAITRSTVALALVVAAAALVPVTTGQPAQALENGLARTPPMGFNNWNAVRCNVNEAFMKRIADFIHTRVIEGMTLQQRGYTYVNIDDCWAMPSRDASGNLVVNRSKFPSGIDGLATYVHNQGLKLGIYADSGSRTCDRNGFPGSFGHERVDALQWARWKVDFMKYDNCNQPPGDNMEKTVARYTAMRDALLAAEQQTGQKILYSICQKGDNGISPFPWSPDVGNMWRTTSDIRPEWSRLKFIIGRNIPLHQWAKPGAWNDPDMLEIGNGTLTQTEERTQFSMWSIMAAPLLIGTDLTQASAADLAILANSDAIAVNQDPLGRQGRQISNTSGRRVLAKPLANGDIAVALYNETDATATITTSASAIGMPSAASYTLKDLWSKASRTTTGTISASVPAHGTVLYRVSRAGAPGNRHEAENATISQGTVESQHTGFSGSGYVNYTNVAGSYVQWAVNAASAGTVTLRFRYANGTTVNRPMNISVNGGTPVVVNFPGTGAWTTWQTATASAMLNAGSNTIRATANTADGGPNADYLEVATG
jgi:alpha-galactosidase